jgi:hypothetical protein
MKVMSNLQKYYERPEITEITPLSHQFKPPDRYNIQNYVHVYITSFKEIMILMKRFDFPE